MNIDKEKYNQQGFLLMKGFFDVGEIRAIHLKALKLFSISIQDVLGKSDIDINDINSFDKLMFELFEKDSERFINTGKQTQHLIELWRLATSKKIEDLLINLGLDFPNISVRPSMFFNSRYLDKVGHYWKLGSHQDWRSSQGSIDSVTIWYPYVDCNVDLGALEVIPGSHKLGLLECSEVNYYSEIKAGEVNENDYLPVEMKVGDLLIFNSFVVHRSGTNSTNNIRWSTQLRFNNINDKSFRERKMPNPYIYKPFAELVTPGTPNNSEVASFFEKQK